MRDCRIAVAALVVWTTPPWSAKGVEPIPPSKPEPRAVVVLDEETPTDYDLRRLTALAIERNPILAQAAFRIDAARGRALQAGLYSHRRSADRRQNGGEQESRARPDV